MDEIYSGNVKYFTQHMCIMKIRVRHNTAFTREDKCSSLTRKGLNCLSKRDELLNI